MRLHLGAMGGPWEPEWMSWALTVPSQRLRNLAISTGMNRCWAHSAPHVLLAVLFHSVCDLCAADT